MARYGISGVKLEVQLQDLGRFDNEAIPEPPPRRSSPERFAASVKPGRIAPARRSKVTVRAKGRRRVVYCLHI
jgi:hypothetical protein